MIEHANAVLIGCDSFAGEVVDRLGVDRARFTIVPGAVDVSRFTPAPDWQAGQSGNPIRLLYHGRVDRRKGVLDFIQALAILRDRGTRFIATISGIGPDLDASRALVAEHALDHAVRFTGAASYDAAPLAYHDQDVFVSPTYMEGFSNTVLEAMASGLPIVSCVAVGVIDCLRDNENGLLVEPGDVPAQADAIERLVRDEALRRRLAQAALAECRATYAWKPVVKQILDVYVRVSDQSAPSGFDAELPRSPCRYRDAPHLL